MDTQPATYPCGWLSRLVQAWRERRELERELGSLPAEERHRLLADVGLNDDDLEALLIHPEQVATLLPTALARYGVDVRALEHDHLDLLHDLQRTCAHCQDTRRCRHLLDEPGGLEAHGKLCPNAATIRALPAAK